MFNFIRKHFTKPATPTTTDDTPEHKGFAVRVTRSKAGGLDSHKRFATLHEAQIYVYRVKAIARGYRHVNQYTIRNLETGRFSPYKWQLTRDDVAMCDVLV